MAEQPFTQNTASVSVLVASIPFDNQNAEQSSVGEHTAACMPIDWQALRDVLETCKSQEWIWQCRDVAITTHPSPKLSRFVSYPSLDAKSSADSDWALKIMPFLRNEFGIVTGSDDESKTDSTDEIWRNNVAVVLDPEMHLVAAKYNTV